MRQSKFDNSLNKTKNNIKFEDQINKLEKEIE